VRLFGLIVLYLLRAAAALGAVSSLAMIAVGQFGNRVNRDLVVIGAVPFCLCALLSVAFWWPVLMRERRRDLCEACKYSRDGLAEATPCPECGKAP
jgi:hypothetical protein